MSDCLNRLRESDAWVPNRPTSDPDASRAVADSWGRALPDAFAQVVDATGGGHLRSTTSMYVMTLAQLIEDWNTDNHMPDLPSAIVFGHDGGGSFFYFDPDDTLGHGRWAVFLVRMADLDRDGSIYVAGSFEEAVDVVMSGEDLYERPELGGSQL